MKKLFVSIFTLVLIVGTISCKNNNDNEEEIKLEENATSNMDGVDATSESGEASTTNSADQMQSDTAMNAENSIAVKASESQDLTTLVAALKAAELDMMLTEKGNYTVFAPTNNAFSKLPEGTVDDLMKPENKEMLKSVLQYHVVSGKIKSNQLVDAIESNKGKYTFKTVTGGELTAMMDGDQIVLKDERGDKAHIVQGNIEASNGVVHIIDDVVMSRK